jgi:hypothetical protein
VRPPYQFEEVAAQIGVRMIEDAVTAGLPDVWERRAAEFEAARPKRGDYFGRSTRAARIAQDARCAATAEACRQAAVVARTTSPWWLPSTITDVFEGVAA